MNVNFVFKGVPIRFQSTMLRAGFFVGLVRIKIGLMHPIQFEQLHVTQTFLDMDNVRVSFFKFPSSKA